MTDHRTCRKKEGGGRSPPLPLLYYYLLRVPLLKFILRLASDVVLAMLVTFRDLPWTADSAPNAWAFYVWPAGALLSEYAQVPHPAGTPSWQCCPTHRATHCTAPHASDMPFAMAIV